MPRSSRNQSKHDAEVRKVASQFERKGYSVKADVSGFPQPGTVRGFRPDVVAQKGRERKIVEVETTDSVDSARDQQQQKAFRQAADNSKHTTFSRRVI